VKLWNAENGQELLTLQGASGTVAFSADGKRLASTSKSNGLVKVWDAKTGRELLSLPHPLVTTVSFSADGQQLASGAWGTVRIWDAQTGGELRTIKGTGNIALFMPDGQSVVTNTPQTFLKIFNTQQDQEYRVLTGVSGAIAACSSDFNRLAIASRDSVSVWDAQGPQTLTLKGHTTPIRTVAISADGKRVVSGGSGRINPDGTSGAGADDRAEVKIWDSQTGQEIISLPDIRGMVWRVAYSPDGQQLATAVGSGAKPFEVKLWDVKTWRQLHSFPGDIGPAGMVVFSPDGKRLAYTAMGSGYVKVYDTQTGEWMQTGRRGSNLAFTPDGKRMLTGATVCDVETGQDVFQFQTGGGVLFSPDGKRLAGNARGNVKLWDTETGQEVLSLTGAGTVIAFSPDGNRLATNAPDGTVRIYDATPLPEKP
jgi:WD40 repeat protein